jgi:hypothetical protein
MNDRELIAGLDLCRPTGDDLAEVELKPVADELASDPRAREIQLRIERIDARMWQSLHDVPVPSDFHSRLLERLRKASTEVAVAVVDNTVVSSSQTGTTFCRAGRLLSRRRWLAWYGGVLAAAAALVAAIVVLRPPPEFEREQLEASREWHAQIMQQPSWQDVRPAELKRHLLPDELRFVPSRYCDATEIVGRQSLAYDLSIPGGPSATLFVLQNTSLAGVPMTAPVQPQSTTQGCSVAYWERNGTTYVVVVESDRIQDYRALLQASAPQAA